jgi:hypothetical protein
MALYKDSSHVKYSSDAAFDQVHDPGTAAPFAGIYRCTRCGHEIGIAAGHTLPPQTHPQHPASLGSIQWQLLVYAEHNK